MSFVFHDLDAETRQLMLEEIAMDISDGKLYLSSRLNAQGREAYPELLQNAAEFHDETWLTQQIQNNSYLNATEARRHKMVAVPYTAAITLAEGEFNRYYIRAVCKKAIASGKPNVEVYRAKHVQNARSASQQKIGTVMPAQNLLDDLRHSQGINTALGLPPGPNSGLSIKLC